MTTQRLFFHRTRLKFWQEARRHLFELMKVEPATTPEMEADYAERLRRIDAEIAIYQEKIGPLRSR